MTVYTDYRKWILFNKQLSNFELFYDLYKTIQYKESYGSVTLEKEDVSEKYIVSQKNFSPSLTIGKLEFTSIIFFLKEHYLLEDDIEDWFERKCAERDKVQNNIAADSTPSENIDFVLDSKEMLYLQLRIFFSGLVYLGIAILVFFLFKQSMVIGVASLFMFLGLLVVFLAAKYLTKGIMLGIIKGGSVRLNENQYPEIYNLIKTQSKMIGLMSLPTIYITHGDFNAFVTRFAKKNVLMLHSELVETSLSGDYDVLKFVIGHELAHIKRNHLKIETWLAPSLLIPFLYNAYSRGCEYTCDHIGYQISPKGAVEGLLILANGKSLYSKVNLDDYLEDAKNESDFWLRFSEIFLSHPHICNRLLRLKSK